MTDSLATGRESSSPLSSSRPPSASLGGWCLRQQRCWRQPRMLATTKMVMGRITRWTIKLTMTNKKLIQSLIFQNRLKQYFVSEFESRGDGPRDSGLWLFFNEEQIPPSPCPRLYTTVIKVQLLDFGLIFGPALTQIHSVYLVLSFFKCSLSEDFDITVNHNLIA